MGAFLSWIRLKWDVFCYNFHWQQYPALLGGNVGRLTAFIPLIGYLVLFNDGISQFLTFNTLVRDSDTVAQMTVSTRLRFLYFGLIFIGLSQLIYFLRRPHVVRLGKNIFEFKDRMLALASPSVFIEINGKIRRSGIDPYTQGGKYYDRDYEGFIEMATGSKPGNSMRDAYNAEKAADWDAAVRRYEPLLTGMLEEHYFAEGTKRRFSLSIAIVLGFLGLVLLAIPSAELFIRVVRSTF